MGINLPRLFYVALIPASLAAVVVVITLLAPRILANSLIRKPPQEPIAFDHSVHAGTLGINCLFCHRTAPTAGTAGLPDVQQCMFCHQVVSQSSLGAPGIGLGTFAAQAEMDKIRTAWREQRPIVWERVHRLPDHARFLHEAHLSALSRMQNVEPAGTCVTCHGDVKSMGQVTQVRALSMGDCVGCHRQNNAPTECMVCHKRTKRGVRGQGAKRRDRGQGTGDRGSNRHPSSLSPATCNLLPPEVAL